MEWLAASDYWLSRLVFQRALAGTYLVAFLVAANQVRALIGAHGLTPVPAYLSRVPGAWWERAVTAEYVRPIGLPR